MPIDFVCACGRRLRVPDESAGKFARCPACRGLASVPGPKPAGREPESDEEGHDPKFVWSQRRLDFLEEVPPEPAAESCGLEVVEEQPAGESCDLELVEEEDPPATVLPLAEEPPEKRRATKHGNGAGKKSGPRRRREKPTMPPPPPRESGLAGFYTEVALEERRREEMKMATWTRGNGLTLFGVHITAGVLGGSLMLCTGLLCLAVFVFFYKRGIIVRPRIIAAAVVYTTLGAATLIRSLVFGQEN
jgi:hypothetical protein